MAKLSKQGRQGLSLSQFGLPDKRAYPVHDAHHARFAKLVAAKQVKTGGITPEEKRRIDAKANQVLNKRRK